MKADKFRSQNSAAVGIFCLSPLTGLATVASEGEARIIGDGELEPTPPGVRLLANEMSEVYPLLTLIVVVWIACFIQSHRLFYKFRAKYPDIAKREIPHAFETRENPEKLLYFLRRKSLEVLRSDPELRGLRQQVKFLAILSVIVPPVGFAFSVRAAIIWAAR